jgi:hypothetical protein
VVYLLCTHDKCSVSMGPWFLILTPMPMIAMAAMRGLITMIIIGGYSWLCYFCINSMGLDRERARQFNKSGRSL